jgi:uncharacterized membrane protein YedE/YeeE
MSVLFEWGRALVGGLLIGTSTSLFLAYNGRVAGISGIAGGLVVPVKGDVSWRAMFIAGLVVGGVLAALVAPSAFGTSGVSLALVALAGALVGVGTRLGNGCTSGHGVCGISRFSPRSIAATVTFVTTGMITVLVARAARGGA